MHNVYNRVAVWNGRRYPREYNHNLTLSLLREEYSEWLSASEDVDKLDALCDIIYVALGAIWKLDASSVDNEDYEEQATQVANKLLNVTEEPHLIYFVGSQLDVMQFEKDYPTLMGLHLIIKCALIEALAMGLSYEQCIQALLIVCDSNDTKSVQKTDPSVKANSGNKGALFVSPEPRLQLLLDTRGLPNV